MQYSDGYFARACARCAAYVASGHGRLMRERTLSREAEKGAVERSVGAACAVGHVGRSEFSSTGPHHASLPTIQNTQVTLSASFQNFGEAKRIPVLRGWKAIRPPAFGVTGSTRNGYQASVSCGGITTANLTLGQSAVEHLDGAGAVFFRGVERSQSQKEKT